MSTTRQSRSRGFSLVELVVFIVLVSVAVAGVLGALNVSTRASVDPMIQKQALAIAEALLEEVQLQPLTYCDPDDPNAPTALNTGACTGGVAGSEDAPTLGPEGETRTSAITPFDNVSDYMAPGGFTINPITDITGTAIPGLTGYSATITVARQGVPALAGPVIPAIPAAEALLISVTVTGPASTTVVLHGYRMRYAPNALP